MRRSQSNRTVPSLTEPAHRPGVICTFAFVGKARFAIFLAGAGLLLAAPGAQAEITSVFDGAVPCVEQEDGSRFCGGTDTLVETFDGQLIDVNVALPPEPESGPDGPYPLVMQFHGYGGSELDADDLKRWTDQGYAAFSMSDRGFGPCGAKPTPPARCAAGGWVRLMDTRYEVRDAQALRRNAGRRGHRRTRARSLRPAAPTAAASRWRSPLSRTATMVEDGSLVCRGRAPMAPASASPRRSPRSRGPISRTRSCPTAARSTMSQTRPISAPTARRRSAS